MVIGQNPAIENSIWIREDVINAHKDVSLVLDPVIWLPIKHISQVSQGSLIPCLSLLKANKHLSVFFIWESECVTGLSSTPPIYHPSVDLYLHHLSSSGEPKHSAPCSYLPASVNPSTDRPTAAVIAARPVLSHPSSLWKQEGADRRTDRERRRRRSPQGCLTLLLPTTGSRQLSIPGFIPPAFHSSLLLSH